MLILLMSSAALAGKLENGWRGIPYGPAEVLEKAPGMTCLENPEAGVRWKCAERVADVSVESAYMVDHGFYTGVNLTCHGYADCRVLYDTVTAAWAVPFTRKRESDASALADGFFNLAAAKTGVCASWEFNDYTNVGTLLVIDMVLAHRVESLRKAEAARAAEAL